MSQQKQQPLSVQQILLFHETRLKQLDETLKTMTDATKSVDREQEMKENTILKTMAMNQRNFNAELEKFANRVTKVEQLLIDVSVELSKLKNLTSTSATVEKEEVTLEVVEKTEDVKETVQEEVKAAVKVEIQEKAEEVHVEVEEVETEKSVSFAE